jgi:hypothetical protein
MTSPRPGAFAREGLAAPASPDVGEAPVREQAAERNDIAHPINMALFFIGSAIL